MSFKINNLLLLLFKKILYLFIALLSPGYSSNPMQQHREQNRPDGQPDRSLAGRPGPAGVALPPVNPFQMMNEEKQEQSREATQINGVAVNDDKGEKATAPYNKAATHSVIQGIFAFSGFRNLNRRTFQDVRKKVLEEIDKNKQLLEENFDRDELTKIMNELDEIGFGNIIYDLMKSPIDYGEVNPENPQHLIQFFYTASKFLNSNYKEQREKDKLEKETMENRKDSKENKSRELSKQLAEKRKENTERYYKTALLGTGASIADYLNVNGRSLDAKETIIIGKQQPWKKDAAEGRGIGFVNHPMHMISPVRHKTQLPADVSGTDETFQGNAEKLSRDIEEILTPFQKVNATISKVVRLKDNWYKIQTDAGPYYALKVVAGLGIGPHKFKGLNKLQNQITSDDDKKRESDQVMDLDAFQRQLSDPQSEIMKRSTAEKLTIGVAGPNAGVDAVHTATNHGMIVKWVVTGGPAIAEGMGNKISRKKLVDLYFDYLKGWTISAGFIEMNISGKWPDKESRKKAGDDFLRKNTGWDVSNEESALVDYLVIAQGPDVSQVWNIFDESVTGTLTLKGDKQGRFGAPENAGSRQGAVTTSLRSSTYNVYWEGIYERVKSVLTKKNASKWENTGQELFTQVKEILDVDNFDPIVLENDVAIGLGAEDDSLEIIGGSAIRILNYLDNLKGNNRDKVPEKLKEGKTEEKMKEVIKTLSSPTLLNNDQLTPIRSQIEAQGDYMPGYIGTEESNFVTDDQTMIAAQLAASYGNIPPALANWVTQKIIQDRHKEGVKPGTAEGSRKFVNKWKDKLQRLHQLFSEGKIKTISDISNTKTRSDQ